MPQLTPEIISAMTPQQYKVAEDRLRRAAARQGLQLRKSRRRDPRAVDYAQYMLVDERNNAVVGPVDGLDVIEKALTADL